MLSKKSIKKSASYIELNKMRTSKWLVKKIIFNIGDHIYDSLDIVVNTLTIEVNLCQL